MTTIVVIAKEPVPGRVKTRLCPPCTAREAAGIATAALSDTLATVSRTAATHHVLALDGRSGPWLPPSFTVVPQVEGDLADRLAAAVDEIAGPVLVIGMDTPQVTVAQLDDACTRVQGSGHDAVLGLACDGGYWAIGFRGRRHGAFRDVEMSSSRTGEQQQRRLRELGLRVHHLPVLRDVDTFEDARTVAATVPGSAFALAVASSAVSA